MTAVDDPELALRRCQQGNRNSDGLEFTACEGTPYLSLDAHRSLSGTRHLKSIWNLSRPDECHVFCAARLGKWADAVGNYWAVAKDGEGNFGDSRERMAFFPVPTNVTDRWHGFPVGRKRGLLFWRDPPADLVQRWTAQGRISRVTRARIIQRKL
jgi:hypothetical protein